VLQPGGIISSVIGAMLLLLIFSKKG
jgi:uncharacterized membrane protein YeaQ/YmgE (transglycosylase-associated protein family)